MINVDINQNGCGNNEALIQSKSMLIEDVCPVHRLEICDLLQTLHQTIPKSLV